MTPVKNVYALMLALVIVLSGCFGLGGGDAEAMGEDDATTVINNYYWNNTTVIQEAPEYITQTASGGPIPAESPYYKPSILTIHQSAGESIHLESLHPWMYTESASDGLEYNQTALVEIYTNCTNGMEWRVSSDWLPGAGLECTHELAVWYPIGGVGVLSVHLSVLYQRVPVTVG